MKKRFIGIIFLCAMLIVSLPLKTLANEVFEQAVEKYAHGKFQEAIDILSGYVEKRPEPAAYWMIGYSLYKLQRFDEADEYFRMAYLINPHFSPKEIEAFAPGLEDIYKDIQQQLKEEFEREVIVPEEAPPEMPTFEVQPGEITPSEPAAVEGQAPGMQQESAPMGQPQQPAIAPVVPPSQQPPVSQPVQPAPPGQFAPPVSPQQFPGMEEMGGMAAIMGMMAGFMTIIIIVEVILYVFYALCIFLIARKLHVPAAWTAWIPIAQIWPIVGAAGKPWWWMLVLLLGPFIGIPFMFISEAVGAIVSIIIALVILVVWIQLWMLISENLGKSKWWGFLMWIPGAFFFLPTLIILGYLAFSESQTSGLSSGMDEFGGDVSGASGLEEEF